MTPPPWLEGLNPEQRRVVLHDRGPLLVLAGAGSGKTRALTCRIAHLISDRGVRPDAIAALTFTNRAAREMKERVAALCGPRAEGVFAGTFHAFGARFLRKHAGRLGRSPGFTIYDSDDQLRLCKRLVKALGLGERSVAPADARRWIEQARRGAPLGGLSLPPGIDEGRVEDLLARYQAALDLAHALDFGDLIRLPADALAEDEALRSRMRAQRPWILVDEYQDTDSVQERLLDGLSAPEGDLMVVGDDDQAIYGWRGAEVANILGFEGRRPGTTVVRLERNYRSTASILAAADGVIARNTQRLGKRLIATLGDGEPVEVAVFEDGRAEARSVAGAIARALRGGEAARDFAVFYRTNAQSRAFEDSLRRQGLPYEVVGGVRFYDRAEIKDVLAYARVVVNRRDDVACLRILNNPARGIGKKTEAALVAAAQAAGACAWDAIRQRSTEGGRAGKALASFVDLIERLDRIAEVMPASQALAAIADESGYADALRARQALDPAARDRLDNLHELLSAAAEHERGLGETEAFEGAPDGLAAFLEAASLHSTIDGWDDSGGRVTLMTLHAAKGLEFSTVFLTGVEESLFPLARTGSVVDLEEERRLAYVGITRARRRLVLSWARRRMVYGETRVCTPSRFLREIPPSALKTEMTFEPGHDPRGRTSDRRAPRTVRDDPFSESDFVDEDPDLDSWTSALPALGARVVHDVFGEGEVVEHLGGQGEQARVAVLFPLRGVKRIVASYLAPA